MMTKIAADTDERARGAQVEGIIEDWIAANPSLVGELEIQIVRDLSDRISAALVEKESEVWDKAIALLEVALTTTYDFRGNVPMSAAAFKQNLIDQLKTAKALEAARSEREK